MSSGDIKSPIDILSTWEALAQPERRPIPCPDGRPGCCVLHYSSDLFDTPDKKRIRALIDLIRKKDEALKEIDDGYHTNIQECMNIAKEALTLTDELK